MASPEDIQNRIFTEIELLLKASETPSDITVSADTALIGDNSMLDSMKLVELCITLEDMAAELGFDFDWTSEAAMSRSRSMFRDAGSLAAEFLEQMKPTR